MAMHHVTVSTTCLVDEHSVLPLPTSWYHPSNCQQSAAEPLKLRLHTSGIHCQLTSLWQARCPPVKTFLIQAVISWIIYWHHPASGRAVVAPLRPLWKFTDWLIDWLVLISLERCWHQFQLPNCIYKFHEQSFILSSLFDFWNNFFFWIGLFL